MTDSSNNEERAMPASSLSFLSQLNWVYLVGYLFAAAGDNLYGSYRYALLKSYGMSRSIIEVMYVLGYASSLLFGTVAASLADVYGRRLACILCAVFFIIMSVLLNIPIVWVALIANLAWGVAHAFHATAFEAWLIQEHRNRLLGDQILAQIFQHAYVGTGIVSIFMGISAQLLVEISSYRAPFNLSIVFFVAMIIFVWNFWPENYGNKKVQPTTTFTSASEAIRADYRIVVVGICSALNEASIHIFITEWTPTLNHANGSIGAKDLPYGYIFAIFMAFDMIGSLVFYPLAKRIQVQSYMIIISVLTSIVVLIPVLVPKSFIIILSAFAIYEFCIGLYRPSMAILRSVYIPNETRTTIMSYMRVPQLICTIIVLLGHFPLSTVYILCCVFNVLALICMITLRTAPVPNRHENMDEREALLDEPPSPLFQVKKSPIRVSSSASLIPQDDINESTHTK
ncbi:unnamed protein product [Adineta ricciae]|uniref:Uncharacterized protein n=1 Tax=Adineta ricciae TaxID=249248 RepID=A0A815HC93_ADIRI|nr:unnamed protein product [Adineta ricciae]CAF1352187.1 unnamed protein product [Adineta ricciae]